MRTSKLLIAFIASLFFMIGSAEAQKQQYTISGKVISADDQQPLSGANIRIQNTLIGTSANLDGNFTIEVRLEEGNYTLQFTFIGFTPVRRSIELGNETNVDLGTIEMQADVLGADEIVVTGTSGPVSKKQLGNAISTVNYKSIEASSATQIDQALSGKIAGALVQQNSGDPAGGISVRLRGASTFLGSAQPLYVIDGVIVSNDSPELIDIGGTSQNRLVDINPADIERIEVVKGAAAAALYGSRANNGVIQIFTKKGKSGKPKFTFSSKVNVNSIRKKIPVNNAQVNNDGTPNPDIERFDFQDFIFRTSVGNEQYLSISGGKNDTRYFMSGSRFQNEGIVNATDFERITGRLNLDQDLANWASISLGLSFTHSESNTVPNGGLNSSFGALTGFIFGPNTFDPRRNPETGEFPDDGFLTNPVEAIERFDFEQKVNRVIGSAKLSLLPLDGLSIDYTIGFDTFDQIATAFIPPGTSASGLGEGFGRRSEFSFFQLNNDLNIRYKKDITDQIESTSLIGGTLQYEQNERFSAQATQFSPFITVVGGGSNFDQPGEFNSENVITGAFAQQTFGFKDRYFLTGAGRVDASSVFGENSRVQYYPKVSGAYVVSEEQFWNDTFLSNAISSFKLRASLGWSGGLTAIDAFDRFTTFSPQSFNGTSSLLPSTQRGAEDVEPERQREIEFGGDISFYGDRLTLEVTRYKQRTKDLLLFRTVAPTTGFQTQLGNFGQLDNNGLEFFASGIPIDKEDKQLVTTITFANNDNEISGIEGGTLLIPDSFGQVAAINGEPLGVFFSDAFERDANGNIVTDNQGLPVEAEGDKIIGDPNPDWVGSFINELTIGENFNFRMQWDFSIGNDVFNFTRRLGALPVFGTHQDVEDELEGRLPEGFNSRVFGIFEQWIEDGSFGKLRELSVSYSLYPKKLQSFRSLRFTVTGRNLISIDSFSGFDPETNVAGQRTAVRGFDFVQVPIPRSVEFGVTANF